MEPLGVAQTKTHLRFGSAAEDGLIENWILAARQHFEQQTGRQLVTATWDVWLDGFPCGSVIELPHPPLLTVTSVKYYDTTNTLQTWAATNYVVQAPAGPYAARGQVEVASGVSWPSTTWRQDAVKIRYTAGYGSRPDDVPEIVRTALYLLVGHFWTNREEVIALLGGTWSAMPLGASVLIKGFEAHPQRAMRRAA